MAIQIEYRPEHEQPRPRKGDRRFGAVKLTEGFNQVEEDDLKAIQDDSVFKALVECDAIKLGGKAPKETPEETPIVRARRPSTPPTES